MNALPPSAHQYGCPHAAEQALARYGVSLSPAAFGAMVADIVLTLAGDRSTAILLQRQRFGRELWLVRLPDGRGVRVVYEPMHAMIVTVLPPDYSSRRS